MPAKILPLPVDAVDRLLSDIGKEYKSQVALTRKVRDALDGLTAADARLAELKGRAAEIVEQAFDGDEIINPDLEPAILWLSETEVGEGLASGPLGSVAELCESQIEQVEELRSQLADVAKRTPKRAFYDTFEED